MAEEVAALNVRLEATIAKFARQMQKAQKTLRQVESRAERSSATVNKSLSRMGSGFRGGNQLRGALGNVGQQIQDIAVQAQAGTAAMTIFAQQGPQIAGAFGATGAILGSVVAVAALVGSTFLSASAESENLGDSVKSLDGLLKNLKSSSDLLSLSLEDIRERFGDNVDEVNRLRVAIAQSAIAQLTGEVTELKTELDDVFARFAARQPDLSIPGLSPRVIAGFRNSIRAIQEELGVSEQGAVRLGEAFQQVREAGNMRETAQGFSEVNRIMDELGVDVSALPPEIAKAISKGAELQLKFIEADTAVRDLNSSLERGTDNAGAFTSQATSLAGELSAAAAEAERLFAAQSAFMASRRSVRDEDRLMSLPVEVDTAPPGITPRRQPARSRGGSGGSRSSRPDNFANAQERAQDQIRTIERRIELVGKEGLALDRLRSRQEASRLEEGLLEEAKKRNGSVSAENKEKIDALVQSYLMVSDQLAVATEAQSQFEAAQQRSADAAAEAKRQQEELARSLSDIATNFAGAIAQADSFEDALKRVAFQLAEVAIRGAFGQGPLGTILGGLTGFAGGATGANIPTPAFSAGAPATFRSLPLSSIPPFANGGVARGLSLVGEKGPELVNFGSPSRVFSNAESSGMMGGVTINNTVNAPGAVEGTAAQIKQQLDQFSRTIPQQVAAAQARAKV